MQPGKVHVWCVVAFVAGCACAPPVRAQDQQAAERLETEIQTLTEALATQSEDPSLLKRRALLLAACGRSEEAILDFDRLIELGPATAALYDARGSEQFKMGHIEESIADFDRGIALAPDQEPWHWKRGISYYYAEQWDAGRRQFENYQTVDDNDVENAVWRYLCMARKDGLAAARADLLKIKRDLRVPMTEIYELYAGRKQPADVLAAAEAEAPHPEAQNARRFYAHLYLGLYYEVAGDGALARRHLELARQHKIGHYMWNVADVHCRRLAQMDAPAP